MNSSATLGLQHAGHGLSGIAMLTAVESRCSDIKVRHEDRRQACQQGPANRSASAYLAHARLSKFRPRKHGRIDRAPIGD
jgi:hypothetical protein